LVRRYGGGPKDSRQSSYLRGPYQAQRKRQKGATHSPFSRANVGTTWGSKDIASIVSHLESHRPPSIFKKECQKY
jgi:hypothetical protein